MFDENNPPNQIKAQNMVFVRLGALVGYIFEYHLNINAMINHRLLHSIGQRPLLHFLPNYRRKIEKVRKYMCMLWPLPTSMGLLLLEPTKIGIEIIIRLLLYNDEFLLSFKSILIENKYFS